MKVTGPGTGPGPTPEVPEATAGTDSATAPAAPEESGRLFAEKLAGAEAAAPDQAAGAAGARSVGSGPRSVGSIVSPQVATEIASDLAAGRLGPRAAVEKVIEQVLSRQLGADAPAGVREKVRAALEDALENDPLLADKLRRLGG